MDPVTIGLFVMAVLWLIRRGVEDVTAMVTGREAPRLVRMRERRAAHRLTVTEAVGVRIARFITEGRDRDRPRGPMREYLGELWADAWQDAREGHERRRTRTRTSAPSNPTPDVDETEILDAEVVDTDTWADPWDWAADPADDHTDTPAPDPAQEPLRKEPPMTSPTTVTVPGEVTSPRQALAWADANLNTNNQVADQLHYLVTYLKGAGLGPAALATVGAVLTAADGFTSAARGAQGVYAEHVLIHQDLSSDPALRDTLRGYLDAAHV